jgi:hypothetical protein
MLLAPLRLDGEPIGRHNIPGPCAFCAALKQRLLTAHMSIGNKMNALEWREDLSCGTIFFFGSDPENAKLLGLQKATPDK